MTRWPCSHPGWCSTSKFRLERAFWGPSELARRMGAPLDAATIASMDPEKFASLFKETPALHRFPGSMAGRVQAVCRIVADEYGREGRFALEESG